MITEKEEQFLRSWEMERETLSSFSSKLFRGLPMALVYGLPILLFVVVVQLFMPEWYTRISNSIGGGTSLMIVISVLLFIIFFSYFRMHYKWEMNEQLYKELKSRQRKLNAGKET